MSLWALKISVTSYGLPLTFIQPHHKGKTRQRKGCGLKRMWPY